MKESFLNLTLVVKSTAPSHQATTVTASKWGHCYFQKNKAIQWNLQKGIGQICWKVTHFPPFNTNSSEFSLTITISRAGRIPNFAKVLKNASLFWGCNVWENAQNSLKKLTCNTGEKRAFDSGNSKYEMVVICISLCTGWAMPACERDCSAPLLQCSTSVRQH